MTFDMGEGSVTWSQAAIIPPVSTQLCLFYSWEEARKKRQLAQKSEAKI
jgi:hypothetical protein